jgi:hypothetical protein
MWRDLLFRGVVFLALALLAFCFSWNYADNSQGNGSKRTPEQEHEETDRRIANYTLGLDIGTGILAISTIGLWIVTWRSGVKQSRDTRRSLAIAKQAANAAIDSNRISRDIFAAENRPWLAVEATLKGDIASNAMGVSFLVDISIHNIGRTPATGVGALVNGFACGRVDPVPILRDYCEWAISIRSEALGRGLTIFPDKRYNISYGAVITFEDGAKNIVVPPNMFMPMIKGCIYYRVGDELRYTGILYNVHFIYQSEVREAMLIPINSVAKFSPDTRLVRYAGGDVAT